MYVVFDTETSGLDPNYNELTEIGAVKLDNDLNEIDRYYCKVKMEYPERMNDYIKKLNHYDEELWKESAIDSKPAVEGFIEFAEGCTKVGHNVAFDIRFVEAAYQRAMEKLFSVTGPKKSCWGKGNYHNIDTCALAAPLKHRGLIKNAKLVTCCEYFDIKNNKAHSAMSDVLATVELFKKLMMKDS